MSDSGVSLFYELMLSGGDVASNRICQVGKKYVFCSLDRERKKKSVVFLSLVVLLHKSPKQSNVSRRQRCM